VIKLKIESSDNPVTVVFKDANGTELPQDTVEPNTTFRTAFEGCLILSGEGATITASSLDKRMGTSVGDQEKLDEHDTSVVVTHTLDGASLMLLDIRE
jgi:hypothetical protein